jgi:Core-2/I-Branching enzyme
VCVRDAAYPEGSTFHKQEIAERVHVSWSHHSEVTAIKELVKAALVDPLNQKFVTLSESSIPLYPAITTYQVLRSEPESRINACGLNVGSAALFSALLSPHFLINILLLFPFPAR